MSFLLNLIGHTLGHVWQTFAHNWPYLLGSIVLAALFQVYLDSSRISAFLQRHSRAGVGLATAAAVGTPLCSCGTMAVILGMIAGQMPWAPIIAFMVASPLTSPQELVYSAGLFGWPFALTFFGASILLGLLAGLIAMLIEARGWLPGQARLIKRCCASACTACTGRRPVRALLGELFTTGRRLVVIFAVFTFVGYLLNDLIPPGWVSALFGGGHIYGVPLAATLALPFYVNTEASLPLARALLDAGMSQGEVLAFLIAGAGTSFGAVAGALTVARWRVIGLVVGILWAGAILSGLALDGAMALGWL